MLFRQFQYLVALDEEHHFGRAAERCNVSQPSLSSGIKQLEYGLGVPIVLRGRRFIGFTQEGERVVEWAKRVISQKDAMMVELSQMRDNLEGRIRIGAMPNSSPILPFFSRILADQHPNVEIDIRFLGIKQTRLGLTNFALDVGITYIDPELIEGLNSMKIYVETLSLLVPENSKWAEQSVMTWEEAAQVPLCLLGENMHERRIIDDAFTEVGCEPKVVVTTADSILNSIFHVMFAGLATVVPSHYAQRPGKLPGTKAVKLIKPEITRDVGLVWSSSEPIMPMAKHMVSIVKGLIKSGEISQQLGAN